MNIHSLLQLIEDLPLAAAMRGDYPETVWLFPIIETLHIFALALVFGSIALLDMRLLGWIASGSPVSRLVRSTLPLTWAAWGCAAVTGSMLFLPKAIVYARNLEFQLKFLMMGLAEINLLIFHFGPYRRVQSWDSAQPPPGTARLAGALSLLLWTAVVFFGRWIGFTT
jgi:hypothetical protein